MKPLTLVPIAPTTIFIWPIDAYRRCICPHGSKHLLRRYLTPQIIPKTFPKKVFGSIGYNIHAVCKPTFHQGVTTLCWLVFSHHFVKHQVEGRSSRVIFASFGGVHMLWPSHWRETKFGQIRQFWSLQICRRRIDNMIVGPCKLSPFFIRLEITICQELVRWITGTPLRPLWVKLSFFCPSN